MKLNQVNKLLRKYKELSKKESDKRRYLILNRYYYNPKKAVGINLMQETYIKQNQYIAKINLLESYKDKIHAKIK